MIEHSCIRSQATCVEWGDYTNHHSRGNNLIPPLGWGVLSPVNHLLIVHWLVKPSVTMFLVFFCVGTACYDWALLFATLLSRVISRSNHCATTDKVIWSRVCWHQQHISFLYIVFENSLEQEPLNSCIGNYWLVEFGSNPKKRDSRAYRLYIIFIFLELRSLHCKAHHKIQFGKTKTYKQPTKRNKDNTPHKWHLYFWFLFFFMLWSIWSPFTTCIMSAGLQFSFFPVFFFLFSSLYIIGFFSFPQTGCNCTAVAFTLSHCDWTNTADTSAGSTALQERWVLISSIAAGKMCLQNKACEQKVTLPTVESRS